MEHNKTLRYIYNTIIIICLTAGIIIVICHFGHFGNIEYTDNARICQHISPQSTRVSGFIKEIRFTDFQRIHKGDTLVIIEDTEYRLRLAQALADLQRAQHSTKATDSSIHITDAGISVTNASIEEARINMENAQREDLRHATLLSQHAGTQQQYDNIHTAYLSACARYEQVLRSRNTQHVQRSQQGHNLSAAEATLELAQAAADLAKLNLSYCYIIATCDGIAGTKDINTGQLVAPGQVLLNIVDANDIWVEANYKESQMPHIHPGASVRITADAVPDTTFTGTVERISDATGSAFSLIPIDNATGNFVKVEQRITVRINLNTQDPSTLSKLRAGYNVECEVLY